MARPSSRREIARRKAAAGGWIRIIVAAAVTVAIVGGYFAVSSNQQVFDPVTLCPKEPVSITAVLIDLTDELDVAQKQDFLNQLDKLRASIPQYGRLSIYAVRPATDSLLTPVITRCNPGTASDASDLSGNPAKLQKRWETMFKAPLDEAFQSLTKATSADTSPILESIQSVALTELQPAAAAGKPKRLIIASDLLQNTSAINFYHGLPDANVLINSAAFHSVSTKLTGVDVDVWMFQRMSAAQVQTTALADLWERMLSAEGADVKLIYNVSG